MKRIALLLSLIISFGLLATAAAQPTSLPDDPRFDQPVEFKTGNGGEQLSIMITSLARAIGLTAIVDDVPDTNITYDIGEPKPFRQVWDVVLTLNNLDYLLLDNDMVVVGTPASVSRLRRQGQAPAATGPADDLIQRFYRVNENPEDLAQVLQQVIPGLNVEILANLNTLSVRATEVQHQQIASTLGQFDTTAAPPVRRLYQLSNANAEALREVLLQTIIASEEESFAITNIASSQNGTTADGGTRTIIRTADLTIAADDRTNSLVVTAPEVIQAEIAGLIAQLDVAQPQINVQVRIQEISTRSAADLGINLSGGLGSFAASFLDGGLRFVFDAQNAISGLNIGAVLDTLEAQRLSRRVDDSNLTMLNNSTGRINSGGRIEITFPGIDGTIQTRTIEFGVIIEITPRISADGRVILDINAEVSDLLVPLSEGGIPQRIDFSTREVSSTITLERDQTVLLGGLLQNSFTTATSRVPILGSLPLIGNLFSSTSTSENNTELLLIVNATVID